MNLVVPLRPCLKTKRTSGGSSFTTPQNFGLRVQGFGSRIEGRMAEYPKPDGCGLAFPSFARQVKGCFFLPTTSGGWPSKVPAEPV